jgi:prepilin peptidase CpaA
MAARYIILSLLLITAVAGDVRTYRIYNLPVALGLGAGFILNFIIGGFEGLVWSLLAAVIPFVLLIALFVLRMLGAGDIKLFCAIGAIMGVKFILYAMAFSFLAGGVIALVIMLVRGNIKQRFHHIATYLKTCFFTYTFTPYTDFGDKSDGAKFHFSVAITAGCIIQIMLFYLQ